ncbi:MAG: NAD(P)H-hydrate dehydratase [bacterium]|nr:NAD(P)H-hydrate dehydratase [bacterium]
MTRSPRRSAGDGAGLPVAAIQLGKRLAMTRRVPRLSRRAADAHKGDCGRVLVVAGSDGMLGAAILATTAALRGGAGLVTAAVPKPLMAPLTIAVPPAMTLARSPAAVARALAATDAVVLGPGIGTTAAAGTLVRSVIAKSVAPVVVDAGALFALSPLTQRPRSPAALVFTPHVGEAARLLGVDSDAVRANRRGAVAALCERTGGVVVLKGAGTLVSDGVRCFRNTTGNAGLATAGSGDVLAGLLGALLADGMVPFDAACAAVHWHGAAADHVARRTSQRGLIASDLPPALAEILP